MNKYLFGIYRIVVPKPLRTSILKKSLRRKILRHFGEMPPSEINGEQKEILGYLERNPLRIFSYDFGFKYRPADIEVFHDGGLGMNYVLLDGKRLFFKKRWTASRIRKGFSDLLCEQDPESPHRYLTPAFRLTEDDVIADIGAAEGNFSLSVIEKVKKCYLFEYNRDWARALRATFTPFGSKAEVINKMVACRDDKFHIMLDTFLLEHKEVTFLKIDVDGAEEEVIAGCIETLKSQRPLRIAFCTYHQADDEKKYTDLLIRFGFNVTTSRGYMIPFYDKKIKSPWLRRGLIRATRSSAF